MERLDALTMDEINQKKRNISEQIRQKKLMQHAKNSNDIFAATFKKITHNPEESILNLNKY